jgi:mannosyl-oligosaccharide glucosidase
MNNLSACLFLCRQVHWDDRAGAYFDVGLHSEKGEFRNLAVVRCASLSNQHDAVDVAVLPELLQQRANPCPPHHTKFLWPVGDGNGGILMRPVYVESAADKSVQFVPRVGVLNVFPLLLRLVPPQSPRLPRLLDHLADPEKLWSPHGMRSLGRQDR